MSNEATLKKLDNVFKIFKASEGKVRPHSIITGPSGSGKTFNVDVLCEKHELPSLEINAAQLTKEGLSGNSLSKALAPIIAYGNTPVIVKVDEFDKLFISGNSNSMLAHESTGGVQNEFLRVLESKTTQVFGDYGKYHGARIENALFVFMGAFNGQPDITLDDLREMGVKTEFLGRVGLVFNMEKPALSELLSLLKKSELMEQYSALFPKVKRQQAEQAIAAELRIHYEKNTLGVRAINTLVHQYFINGGLTHAVAKKSMFERTLDFG